MIFRWIGCALLVFAVGCDPPPKPDPAKKIDANYNAPDAGATDRSNRDLGQGDAPTGDVEVTDTAGADLESWDTLSPDLRRTDIIRPDAGVDDLSPAVDGSGPGNDANTADAQVVPEDAGVSSDAHSAGDAARADVFLQQTDALIPDQGQTDTLVTCAVSFSYSPVSSSALVSGEFNGWAETVALGAWEMTDPDADGTWTVQGELAPGQYQYKFIIDGTWLHDSNLPTIDDGNGNTNNLLTVSPCSGSDAGTTADAAGSDATIPNTVTLEITSHNGPEVQIIQAELQLTPETAILDENSVVVSLNHQPLQTSEVHISGNTITLNIGDLLDGIHDVRVSASATDGQQATPLLLKFHKNVSTDWRDNVLYFAMIDRFANGDISNDAPLTGNDVADQTNYLGGDFAGLQQKIEEDYFGDLGVDAIWISWPIDNIDFVEPGMRPSEHNCNKQPSELSKVAVGYSGYHGYWPHRLDQVESRYGTLDELQAMVNTAHAKGIRIVLDYTANHVHSASPFYTEFVNSYFNWPGQGGDHICEDVGWDGDQRETCWFTSYLADINYQNDQAVQTMVDMAIEWIYKSGADGFRLDAVKHINLNFVRILRQRLQQEVELTGIDFYLVGETFDGRADYIAGFLGSDLLHGQFDFPLNLSVLKSMATFEQGLDALDSQARGIKANYGSHIMSNFVGNHDISRFSSLAAGDIYCGVWSVKHNVAQGWTYPPSRPGGDKSYAYGRLKIAFTYIMTTPGVPLIYYGDEYGMPGAGDPDNRRMMGFDGELFGDEPGMLSFMQRLGQVRAEQPALRTGDWGAAQRADNDVLIYPRGSGANALFVVINRGGPVEVTVDVTTTGVTDYQDALDPAASVLSASGGQLTVAVPVLRSMILVPQP